MNNSLDLSPITNYSAVTPAVPIKKLHPNAKWPTYASPDAAGADLRVLTDGPVTIAPGETVMLHTGLAFAIPQGFVGLVCARSSMGAKKGLAPANKVGVIDADYRGEVRVALHNHGSVPQVVESGDRVAQLVIVPYLSAQFTQADELDDTERGSGGFGSTGSR